MRSRAVIVALALSAACAQPGSEACDRGTFCPPSTICGAQDVCFADVGACRAFDDGMPCLVDEQTSGYCAARACVRGPTLIAYAVSVPSGIGLPGVEALVRAHPEVLSAVGNPNGYFDLRVPRGIEAVIEVSYPDAYVAITRPIAVGETDVLLDFLYGGIPIIPFALGQALAAQVGVALLPDRGILTGVSVEPAQGRPVGDVTFSLASGSCGGPYYFDVDGMVAVGATATVAGSGTFAFVNCEPGVAVVAASAATGACHPLDSASTDPVPMTVEPERVTYLGRMTCM